MYYPEEAAAKDFVCEACGFENCGSCNRGKCLLCGVTNYVCLSYSHIDLWNLIEKNYPDYSCLEITNKAGLYFLDRHHNKIHSRNSEINFKDDDYDFSYEIIQAAPLDVIACHTFYFKCKDYCSHIDSKCENCELDICGCCFDKCPICNK